MNIICKIFGHKMHWVDETVCTRVNKCVRCHDEGEKTVKHQWSNWEYENDSSCTQIRQCKRCSIKEAKKHQHDWTEWECQSDNFATEKRRCKKCPMEEVINDETMLTPSVAANYLNDNLQKICIVEPVEPVAGHYEEYTYETYGESTQWSVIEVRDTRWVDDIPGQPGQYEYPDQSLKMFSDKIRRRNKFFQTQVLNELYNKNTELAISIKRFLI